MTITSTDRGQCQRSARKASRQRRRRRARRGELPAPRETARPSREPSAPARRTTIARCGPRLRCPRRKTRSKSRRVSKRSPRPKRPRGSGRGSTGAGFVAAGTIGAALPLLGRRGGRQALAASGTTGVDDLAPAGRSHAQAEAMRSPAGNSAWCGQSLLHGPSSFVGWQFPDAPTVVAGENSGLAGSRAGSDRGTGRHPAWFVATGRLPAPFHKLRDLSRLVGSSPLSPSEKPR